jgi:putative sterol carrier protein
MANSYDKADFFSEAWWNQVIAAWNKSEYKMSLAGFGLVGFELTDGDARLVWLHWDKHGQAEWRTTGEPDSPVFSASSAHWQQFVMGRFTASIGVLQRRIQFKGQLTRVLPYTIAFNYLGRVSRNLI